MYTFKRLADLGVWWLILVGLALLPEACGQGILDLTPPLLETVGSLDGLTIFACFSEPVDLSTATDPANYVINGGLVFVTGVSLQPNGLSARISVSGLGTAVDTRFTVEAAYIYDLAGNVGGGIASGRVGFVDGCVPPPAATDPRLAGLSASGGITWTNAFTNGVVTIEGAMAPSGPWLSDRNYFTSNSVGGGSIGLGSDNRYFRMAAVEITPTSQGFNNLADSYGVIHTIAGKGEFRTDGQNNWLPAYEGGPATNANLSRPHFAIADRHDNVYVTDKDSHAILRVTPDGNIHTVAGTHAAGFNGDGPAPATTLQLNTATGEWLGPDGLTLYIMDTGNGKIRRLDTNGVMTTLFTITNGITVISGNVYITNGIQGGRGLYVSPDEKLVYFTTDHVLWRWTPASFTTPVNSNFQEMGNIWVQGDGQIIATDRLDNTVWLVETNGSRTLIAGNGLSSPAVDGGVATNSALWGVRGVWPLPTGGYLLATHEGGQVWYLDTAGLVHVFVNGSKSTKSHLGDGFWFHSFLASISSARSVTLDFHGNILIVEHDAGYVRKIDFLRFVP